MDPQTNLYLRYYTAQSGGELSAFHGARRTQVGSGLGDILRGLFRTIFPMAVRGASTFLSEAVRATDAGAGWGDAAKAAIAPTAQNLLNDGLNRLSQKGTGRRHRRKHTPRKAYKRPAHHKRAKGRHSPKKIKFLNF